MVHFELPSHPGMNMVGIIRFIRYIYDPNMMFVTFTPVLGFLAHVSPCLHHDAIMNAVIIK